MAICPECQTLDKNFFAYRCHSCNQEIGFFRQLFWQTAYVTFSIGIFFGILIWIFSELGVDSVRIRSYTVIIS